MPNTLTALLPSPVTITLPAGLWWQDQFTWRAVRQSKTRTLTGGLIVQSGVLAGGRPVTLAPIDPVSALISRADLDLVAAWADMPELRLTLVWLGQTLSVRWAYDAGPAFEARPIWPGEVDQAGDLFVPTFRLTTV
jgi:hypothetical protein